MDQVAKRRIGEPGRIVCHTAGYAAATGTEPKLTSEEKHELIRHLFAAKQALKARVQELGAAQQEQQKLL
jgi:hypothetical protein